jgi:predicted transposase YbfD/YdcC
MDMQELFAKLERINDPRQEWKVKHKLSDAVAIVLLSSLADANDWEEIEMFAVMNEEKLRDYLELPNGTPSHDTIQRVMGMIEPKVLQGFVLEWNELVSSEEKGKLRKILNLDGKTMRGSGDKNHTPLHVLSAWSKEDGISLGQRTVREKENEIVAIPLLLDELRINGYTVTIDAMGCQKEIAKKIRSRKAEYVLAVKGNHGTLHKELIEYFSDEDLLAQIKQAGGYYKTVEKRRGQIEKREYYQTGNILWYEGKKLWKDLKSFGMTQNTIERDGKTTVERRYYICSLEPDIQFFAKAVRGHWAIESMHWQLDVTFREDNNTTMDTRAAENLNIIRKWALAILKMLDVGRKVSLKNKRKMVGWNPVKYLSLALEM